MFLVWTLWHSSYPDKVTVLTVFLLGILGSKSTRELKEFFLSSQVTPSNVGWAVPLGMWDPSRRTLSLCRPGFGQTHWPPAGPPPSSPTALPPCLCTPGTWPCGHPTLGLLGILPGGWPTPHSGRSAPVGGFCGRNSILLCEATAFTLIPLKCFAIYVRNMVRFIPDVIIFSRRSLNELIL